MYFCFLSSCTISCLQLSVYILPACYYTSLPPANEVCEGYVFTRVCHSVHKAGSAPVHAEMHTHPPGPEADTLWDQRQTPWDQRQAPPPSQVPEAGTPPTGPEAGTPQEQCVLGNTGNKRAVRILLECILVFFSWC